MMFRRHAVRLSVLLPALIVALALVSPPATPYAQTPATRIMPLGDSITGSPGCWRALLWNRLQNTGFTNIDFVGTLGPQGCGIPYDGDNEGHGGILVTNIASQNLLPGWLAATNPNIVLMHLGTNDVWSARDTATILAAYSTLVDQMRANNPNMKILVAQIIPMNPSSCPACAQRVIDLNAAIPGWASGKSTAQSPIIVVDQWTGFNTATDTSDGVHPNDAGIQKMSDKWYPALSAQLSGNPQPTATRTPTRTATRMPTPMGPTNTPTRTPTRTPTSTPTRTPTGPTATPTRTPTRTPTPGSGACSPVSSTITAPFTFDGTGTFCWQIATIPSYINSWNLAGLTINGVNYTNTYAFASNLPPKINGFWYVSYTGNFAWSHFEAK